MGCSPSKFSTQESISLCKHRQNLIKQSARARRHLAAAYSSYTTSLKNSGAALIDYSHGEDSQHRDLHPQPPSTAAAASIPPSIDPLPPPPPPPRPPKFSPSHLHRSSSMPHLSVLKSVAKTTNPIQKTNDPDEVLVGPTTSSSSKPAPPPPEPESKGNMLDYIFRYDHTDCSTLIEVEESEPHDEEKDGEGEDSNGQDESIDESMEENVINEPLEKQKQGSNRGSSLIHQDAGAISAVDQVGQPIDAAPVSLFQIVNELDDHFLKASESTSEVLKMLEANRMHYHSNFTNNRGHIDHAAQVIRVITWSPSRISNDDDERKDGSDSEEYGAHATTLEKLLEWEKKLYEEVKASEIMKAEYQRKLALLNKQKKQGSNAGALEKARAAASHLHARYVIAVQSMDATLSEIQRLRDDRLYPMLLALLHGMARMWEIMHAHHAAQLRIVTVLRSLKTSNDPNGTRDHHHDRTRQLCRVINEWNLHFQNLMAHQKEYVDALKGWSKSNLIHVPKEDAPSPPIYILLCTWHEQLEKLPIELAKTAISSFGAVVDTIMVQQEEEMKQKEKCEETEKEFKRKSRAFEEWYIKYMERMAMISEGVDRDVAGGGTGDDDQVIVRWAVVEALKKRLEDDEERYWKLCKQVREKSMSSLKIHLPELFRAMSDFSLASSEMYKKLQAISGD
ncbi:nitrate regulatory gene2 protein-like [Magnolia sinica]|uniref:nitrate regulatory gene2 protein-like n=1 Tax=Magnolia sinica TaxID=86752 RepID=UPI002658824F|nr:nitrate regulatory gene2 protein-like [Magnolia sinica]